MVGDKKKVFVTTRRALENAILRKKYFRAWHYTTQKSTVRNIFFFVYHKLGRDTGYKSIDFRSVKVFNNMN